MAGKRTSEKTVEMHEFYLLRSPSGSLPPLCAECSTGDAIMVAAEQAALIARVPARTVYRWIEAGLIHYKEKSDGSTLVCVKSLSTASNQVKGA